MSAVDVLVGLLADSQGRWLIGSRRPGKELAEYWEFPGGKRQPGEERLAALKRELDEELGIEVLEAEPLLELFHDYPTRRVRLDVWLVRRYRGTAAPREGQQLRWVAAEELPAAGLLPADRPIVDELLRLPAAG